MAIQFKSKSFSKGTGTSPTIQEPSPIVSGDLLIAVYAVDSSAGPITIPSGWTQLYGGSSAGNQFKYLACYCIRGDSAPSYSFGHTGSAYYEATILTFQEPDTYNPIPMKASEILDNTSTPGNPQTNSITTTSNNQMILHLGVSWGGSGTTGWAPPKDGYTLWSDNTPGNRTVAASKLAVNAGVVNPPWEFSGAANVSPDTWGASLVLGNSQTVSYITANLVGSYQTAFDTGPSSQSIDITTNQNDTLICMGFANAKPTLATPTGGTGVSWSSATSTYIIGLNKATQYYWTAENVPAQTFTLSVSATNVTGNWGLFVMQFSQQDPLYSTSNFIKGTYSGSRNNFTVSANRYQILTVTDANAVDGTNRVYDKNTLAQNMIEMLYYRLTGFYTIYVMYYPLCQPTSPLTSASYYLGLSAPTGLLNTLGGVAGTLYYPSRTFPPVGWFGA